MAIRLLDTNIVSFVTKQHALAELYRPHLFGHTLAVSFMSLAELLEGSKLAGWGIRRRTRLKATINNLLVVHSDQTVCAKWADIRVARRSQPIGAADCWIAATALAFGLELVTHNPIDYQNVPGLMVITEAP